MESLQPFSIFELRPASLAKLIPLQDSSDARKIQLKFASQDSINLLMTKSGDSSRILIPSGLIFQLIF